MKKITFNKQSIYIIYFALPILCLFVFTKIKPETFANATQKEICSMMLENYATDGDLVIDHEYYIGKDNTGKIIVDLTKIKFQNDETLLFNLEKTYLKDDCNPLPLFNVKNDLGKKVSKIIYDLTKKNKD
jgi:hypothetical protein